MMNSIQSNDGAALDTIMLGEDAPGGRLDRVLADELAKRGFELSRTRTKSLIEQGQVRILRDNERRTILDANFRVKPGDQIEVDIPPPAPAEPAAQDIPLSILYEDDQLIVVDKPAGIVVHPAPGNPDRTLVNALIAHCGTSLSGIGGVARPGIVHRLDKDTSGVMVVAKGDAAHKGLAAQFAAHGRDGRLARSYTALAWGRPRRAKFTVNAPLGRSPSNRKKMAVLKRGGRVAITHVSRRAEAVAGSDFSLLDCRLETGRTHQIRVHLAHMGHPVFGDPLYAPGRKIPEKRLAARGASEDLLAQLASFPRQALHASELGFEHPMSGAPMVFNSSIPPDMRAILDELERL